MDTVDQAKIDRVERKLSALRSIADAVKSQIGMLLSELGNLERAIADLRPGPPVSCPKGCGPMDRLTAGGPQPMSYICPNCRAAVAACIQCGQALTAPTGNDPYGPDAPLSTDCGGDCLACQRRTEVASGGPSPAGA